MSIAAGMELGVPSPAKAAARARGLAPSKFERAAYVAAGKEKERRRVRGGQPTLCVRVAASTLCVFLRLRAPPMNTACAYSRLGMWSTRLSHSAFQSARIVAATSHSAVCCY